MEETKLASLVERIVREELEKINYVPIGVSNRHIHLSRQDLDTLFGKGYELKVFKDLKQTGQYAAEETVTIKGDKGEFKNVRILGPVRNESQVEISLSDGFKLGVKPPIRESGVLENSPGITLIGPCGSVTLKQGVIAAWRHIHLSTGVAKLLNVIDKETVSVLVEGMRACRLDNVLVRVSDSFVPEMHIDTDEANACGLKNNQQVKIIKNQQ